MLPDYVTEAQEKSESASTRAASMAAGEASVADLIKEKALKAYSDNQDIIGKLDTAQSAYLTSPQAGREKYQDIWNPFQRENLVSQYVQNTALPMLSLSSILGQRFGRFDDLVGAGTRAYQAESGVAQNAADLASQSYQNVLKQYQLEEDTRRWEREMGLKETEANQPSLLESLLEYMKTQPGKETKESSPLYTPMEGEGTPSKGGQWVYKGGQWISNSAPTFDFQED